MGKGKILQVRPSISNKLLRTIWMSYLIRTVVYRKPSPTLVFSYFLNGQDYVEELTQSMLTMELDHIQKPLIATLGEVSFVDQDRSIVYSANWRLSITSASVVVHSWRAHFEWCLIFKLVMMLFWEIVPTARDRPIRQNLQISPSSKSCPASHKHHTTTTRYQLPSLLIRVGEKLLNV